MKAAHALPASPQVTLDPQDKADFLARWAGSQWRGRPVTDLSDLEIALAIFHGA